MHIGASLQACLQKAIRAKRITDDHARQILTLVGGKDDQAREMLEMFIQKTAEAKRVSELQILAQSRAVQAAKSHPDGIELGIELLARDPSDKAGHISNVDFRFQAIYNDAFEKLGVRRLGLATDDALAQRVGRAMFGESVDPEASRLAGELSSSMDQLRQLGNVGGMHIP